ncbi:MAG: 50S ribosomal protein L10 [Enterobacterales bacterium]
MILNLNNKKKIIEEISNIFNKSLSLVIADINTITVKQITILRKLCRESNVYIKVVKNRLIKKIIENTVFKCLQNLFVGSNIIGFSLKDPKSAAIVFENFSKENKNFKIKVAFFEDRIIPASSINLLSKLPTYNQIVSKLMFIMKQAYIGKLINILVLLLKKNK